MLQKFSPSDDYTALHCYVTKIRTTYATDSRKSNGSALELMIEAATKCWKKVTSCVEPPVGW